MPHPTRRRFLNSSFGFAAAMSAGAAFAADEKPAGENGAIPTPDLPARPEKKPEKKRDSLAGANERLNIAVIGCGDRGQYHISELLSMSDHANVVALCDADMSRVENQAHHIEEEIGDVPKGYQDVRKMLEDKSIDAVSIATQNHWHTLASIWAIQAGKDVY